MYSISTWTWIAVAQLHRRTGAPSFTATQIIDEIGTLPTGPLKRQTLTAHVYLHCVANVAPAPNPLRYLYKLGADRKVRLRLFREGDDFHPDRKNGKIAPDREDIPSQYTDLLDWYKNEYSKPTGKAQPSDPILAMRGLGKELWRRLGGTGFIRELRSGWAEPARKPESSVKHSGDEPPARRLPR